ncbi:MAG TPA: AlpA family phage regulatory protein [Gammaproteobacteria bacterium]|nr:AlpA family phage regulatory protein [Gammaproteobacteria bacterium]
MAHQILRISDVQKQVRLSRASIYRLIRAGQFPAPVKLTAKASGWSADAVDSWVASRTAQAAEA